MDIDKDLDFDIVSGADNGMIYCYINNGTSFSINSTYFGSIDVGYASAPALVDIDGDNDEDILIGSETGSSYLFLVREGNNFNIAASNPFSTIIFPNYSRPSFADLDNDGDFDLILGKSFGEVNCYENTGNVQNPQWQRNDALVVELEVKQSSTPGFADLDNDGRIDCIVGEYDGNFTYFKNLFAPTSVHDEFLETPKEFSLSQNYPNPFNPTTKISWQSSRGGWQTLRIYDVLGKEITTLVDEYKPAGSYDVEFDSNNLTSGVYFYHLKAGSFMETKKMILIR